MFKFLNIIFIFFLYSNIYAAADYTMYVTNQLDYSITLTEANSACLYWVHLPLTISAHQTKSFTFEDANPFFGSCGGATKSLTLNTAVKLNAQTHLMSFTWTHDQDSSGWYTTIDNTSTTNLLKINKATCQGNNCLNTKYHGSGNMDLAITIGLNPDKSMSLHLIDLHLGGIQVTNGYGILIPIDPKNKIITFDADKKYIISFSKAPQKCTDFQGFINCPKSIGFITNTDTDTDNLIFICKQISPNNSQCPWLMSNEGNQLNSLNIYG